MHDNEPGCLVEEGVPFRQVNILFLASRLSVLALVFRQRERFRVALLVADERGDFLDFGDVDETALDTDGVSASIEEQVAAADELFGPRAVQDGA